MEKVLSTLITMPDFLAELFSEHLVLSVFGIMVFLLALMVPGRIGSFIRKIVILANVMFAMAGGFMGKRQNGYQIICLSAISLLLLLIIRTIVRIVGAFKQRRIDARIEERALAKAAKRRGSLNKNKEQKDRQEPPIDDFVPPELYQVEIRQVIENEINKGKERNEAALAAYGSPSDEKDSETEHEINETAETEALAGEPVSENESIKETPAQAESSAKTRIPRVCSRGFYTEPGRFFYQDSKDEAGSDIRNAVNCLSELHDKGLLTDEEYAYEKSRLEALVD